MTPDQQPDAGAAGSDEAPGAPEPEQATFDADYVKKLRAEAAKYRSEAKANAEAAKRLAELEESQKTEAQKLAEARDRAEQEAAKARSEALRWRIAAKYGISDEDADLFLTGTDEETLTRQAERLVERIQATTPTPNPVPSQRPAAVLANQPEPMALNGDPLLQSLKDKLGITG